MPNPSTRRGPAGDPSLDTFAPPRAEADPRDAEQPVLFRGVTWDDYEAMLRIRGERRFRITYDRGLREVVFPHRRERFSGVSWDDYGAMLRIAGDGPLRTAYDRGEMEVIMPSSRHEALTRLFQTLLTGLLRALRVPYKSGGSTTFRRLGLARAGARPLLLPPRPRPPPHPAGAGPRDHRCPRPGDRGRGLAPGPRQAGNLRRPGRPRGLAVRRPDRRGPLPPAGCHLPGSPGQRRLAPGPHLGAGRVAPPRPRARRDGLGRPGARLDSPGDASPRRRRGRCPRPALTARPRRTSPTQPPD